MLWEKHQLGGLRDDMASLIDHAHKTKSVSPGIQECESVYRIMSHSLQTSIQECDSNNVHR